MLCLRSKDKTAHDEQYPQRCPKAWHPSAFPRRPPIDHLKVESTSCGLEKLAGCWMRTHKTLNNDTLPHRMTSHDIAKPSTSCGSKWWKSLFYAGAKSSRLGLTVREQTEQTLHSLLLIPQLIMSVLRKSKYAFATVELCFKNPVNICKFCLKQSGFCLMQAPFAAPTKRPRAASPWHGKLHAQAADAADANAAYLPCIPHFLKACCKFLHCSNGIALKGTLMVCRDKVKRYTVDDFHVT